MKKRGLLITEKPSVMNDIKMVYDKIKSTLPYELEFGTCAGHLIGLCTPNEYGPDWQAPWKMEVLPMIPSSWKTKVINAPFFNKLRDTYNSGHFDFIVNAGDPGQEGALIQSLVYTAMGVNIPIYRYWADDTQFKTIAKTLNHLLPDEQFKGMVEAGYLRMFFDWLIGMNFSRAATLSLKRPASLGRVMTPTLAMIVNRENEIVNFVPTEYRKIICTFKTQSGETYDGVLVNPTPNEQKYAFYDIDEANYIEKNMLKSGKVDSVDIKDTISKAPTFFNLSDLQKAAVKKYKYSPDLTLELVQSLYEKRFMSYPRTESKCITSAQAKDMPYVLQQLGSIPEYNNIILGILGNPDNLRRVENSKKYVDDSKVSDHPALTPTATIPTLSDLTEKERNIYELVLKRFLAVFLPDSVSTVTSVTTLCEKDKVSYTFCSSSSSIKEMGWKKIYEEDKEEKKDDDNDDNICSKLPYLEEGYAVNIVSTTNKECYTTAPPRYNEASILTAMETAGKLLDDKELEKILMESAGIGTAATRAEILKKLLELGYIHKSRNILKPTEEGTELIFALKDSLIISPELSASWGKKLKEVERGIITYDSFYNAMCKYISVETASLCKLAEIGPIKKVIGKCPKCNRNFVYGTYIACEGAFELDQDGNKLCNLSFPKIVGKKALTEADVTALISGGETVPKTYTWSSGKKSTTRLLLNDEFKISFPTHGGDKELIGNCPVCKGKVLKGKYGYYCDNVTQKDADGNKKCHFTIKGVLGQTPISSATAKELLLYGKTQKPVKITWDSGKTHESKLVLDENYKVKTTSYEEKELCKCKVCKTGCIIDKQYNYECSNSSCGLNLNKTWCNGVITKTDIRLIMAGKPTKPKKLKFKNGSSGDYSVVLVYYDDKHTYGFGRISPIS